MLLFIAIATLLTVIPISAQFPSTAGVWEAFRGMDHGGRSPIDLVLSATTGNLVWSFSTGSAALTSEPVVDMDGNFYVGGTAGIFYKIAPNGSEVWRFDSGDPASITATASLGASGTPSNYDDIPTVYFGTSSLGLFFALDCETGVPKSEPFRTADGITSAIMVREHLALRDATTAFFAAGPNMIAINVRNNTLRYNTSFVEGKEPVSPGYGFCSCIVSNADGTVSSYNPHHWPGYEPTEGDAVCATYDDLKWQVSAQGGIRFPPVTLPVGSPFPDPVPNPSDIIVVTDVGTVESLALCEGLVCEGEVRNWVLQLPSDSPVAGTPALSSACVAKSTGGLPGVPTPSPTVFTDDPGEGDPKCQIFVTTEEGMLYSVDADRGEINWSVNTSIAISASPTCDATAHIILPLSNGEIRIFTYDGVQVAAFAIGGAGALSNAVVTPSGQVAVGDSLGNLNVVTFEEAI